jgi:hypothetical protein
MRTSILLMLLIVMPGIVLTMAEMQAQMRPTLLADPTLQKFQSLAYKRGKAEAKRDLAQGYLIHKAGGGRIPMDYGAYCDILRARYNVRVDVIAGCVVTRKLLDYIQGYNEVSTAEIERRFGEGVLERTREEVRYNALKVDQH